MAQTPSEGNDRVARRYGTPDRSNAATLAARPDTGPEGQDATNPMPAGLREKLDPATPPKQPAAPRDGQPYGLERCVARSLEANPQMQAVRATFSGSEASRLQALANFGPVGTASYTAQRVDSQNIITKSQVIATPIPAPKPASLTLHPLIGRWQNTYQLQLQATQPLFTGFNLLSSYQKAALNKEYAEANIKYTELILIKTVQQAFLTLLQARSNAQSSKDAVIRLVAQYKVAQAYYDEGVKAHLDMIQAESDLAAAEQSLLKAENAVRIQTAQLNTLLNVPLDAETPYVGELTYLPFSMDLAACLDTAARLRPDLAMAVKSVQMATRDVMIAASPLYPQVQAQATRTSQGNQGDLQVKDFSGRTTPVASTLAVTASLRAWDWGSTAFGTLAANETVKRLQADLAKLRLDVGYQVKTSYYNITDAAKRISVARSALEASREGYRAAVALYQDQVGTSADVLDAQSRLSTAETNLTQALTDYQSGLADLYASMGIANPGLQSLPHP